MLIFIQAIKPKHTISRESLCVLVATYLDYHISVQNIRCLLKLSLTAIWFIGRPKRLCTLISHVCFQLNNINYEVLKT